MNPFRLVGTPRAALAPTPGAGRLSRVLGAGAGRLGRGQAGRARPRGRGVHMNFPLISVFTGFALNIDLKGKLIPPNSQFGHKFCGQRGQYLHGNFPRHTKHMRSMLAQSHLESRYAPFGHKVCGQIMSWVCIYCFQPLSNRAISKLYLTFMPS